MTMVGWDEVKRRVERARVAAGHQARTDGDRAAGRRRIDDEIHAYRLAEVRCTRASTQREVAMAMGVSGTQASDVEHGKLDVVSASVPGPKSKPSAGD
jgi:hypothetical protein